jgi:hypothetical protein
VNNGLRNNVPGRLLEQYFIMMNLKMLEFSVAEDYYGD